MYTSASTAIAFAGGFIVTKVVAVKIGATGLLYIGQYQNITAILTLLATGAVNAGVTKYIAQFKDDAKKQQEVITNAVNLITGCSILISLLVIISSRLLAVSSFFTANYWVVYFLYGCFLTLLSLNLFFAAVFNGLKEIKKLTIVNIVGSLATIFFTVWMAIKHGVKGVLIAGNITALIVFGINMYFIKGLSQFSFFPDFKKRSGKTLNMLFVFTAMTLVSGITASLSQLFIRYRIINIFSIEQAGYWQAITKISDYYLAFITMVLSVYYLPRLSEIKSNRELKNEIKKGYKTILPVVAIMALLIWFCKKLVIQLLFTPAFSPMLPLFDFQLLGDFFKIGSWLLAYIMWAKGRVKMFIVTEITFSFMYVILSYVFLHFYGLTGATYAFCISYLLYWIAMIVIMYFKMFRF